MSFRGDSSWIIAGFGGEKQLLGFANGWSKGKAYYEAHQTFRCALEEIVSTIKWIVKDPKTNAHISEKYKKRLSLLDEEITILNKEADVLLRGMEPLISSS
ncbi:7300_t:CDS:2 [Paraglomus occultum]|uniref:7300_t:CDS:1 n=1 Tax=Paraglomus occultum TaxID=144539 RepID=A0A9N9F3J3_9GLOM|nr:7300_t:CDS:2 [Paraglomus occultum]